MNVVDSSGWIEVLSSGTNRQIFLPVVRDTAALIVPAMVHFEVRKRALILFGDRFADDVEGLLNEGIFIEVTRAIISTGINVSRKYKLSTADSLIYATTLEYDATLWTQDAHFAGLPQVQFYPKI